MHLKKKTFFNKRTLLIALGGLCLHATNTFAQVPFEEIESSKKTLIPNLSVHFTLNSALSQKETEYYKEIVEEILQKMPKQVALTGDNKSLLSGSNKYDKLRVVSYMPDTEQIEDDPTARDIHYFDIQFEVPDRKKLRRLLKQEKANINPSVFVRTDKLEAFMQKVDLLRMGEEINELPTENKETLEKQSISAEVLADEEKLAVASTLKEPTQTSSIQGENLQKTENPVAPNPKKEAPKAKPVAPTKQIKKVELTYAGDRISVPEKLQQSIKANSEKSQYVSIISSTAHSPFLDADTLYQSRLEAINAHTDVSTLIKSEIRLKSNTEQFIQLHFVSQKN